MSQHLGLEVQDSPGSVSDPVLEAWDRILHKYKVGNRTQERAAFLAPEVATLRQRTPTEVDLEVRVPLELLAHRAADWFQQYRQRFTVRGFRRGRAPARLVFPRIKHWLFVKCLDEILWETWAANITALPGQLVKTLGSQLEVCADKTANYLRVTYECEVLPRLDLPQLSIWNPPAPDIPSRPTANQAGPGPERPDTSSIAALPAGASTPEGTFAEAERLRQVTLEALCQATNGATPASLISLLADAFAQTTDVRLDSAMVQTILQRKLHQAQVAHALAVPPAGEAEEPRLATEVEPEEVECRAVLLGIPVSSFRVRYLAEAAQRVLFAARTRQDRALDRLVAMSASERRSGAPRGT
jgi:hypothetical protein